jgi:hypothetical protein
MLAFERPGMRETDQYAAFSDPEAFHSGTVLAHDAYRQLVAAKMGTRERRHLSRALTRVEGAHHQELRTARTTSAEALVAMRRFCYESALTQRTAAAAEAKHVCALEDLRSRLARTERLLAEQSKAAASASREAGEHAARADVNAATLHAELRRLEVGKGMVGEMLADECHSIGYMEHESGLLRLQTRRAGALLLEQTKQLDLLRKKMAVAHRRVQKLDELQQAAYAWNIERARIREQLAAQERATEAALSSAETAEARAEQAEWEAAQERSAARESISQAQMRQIEAEAVMRDELLTLREAWSRLLGHPTAVVSLGAGAGVTLAEFATNVRQRVGKRVQAGVL